MSETANSVLRPLLRDLGVPRDGVLIVHSAIGGLARQGISATDIIECLLDNLADGTLLMPTMTWRTVTDESPRFDVSNTPSHTGALTELFRTRYATHRSLHPTHSVAGRGPLAGLLLATHQLGGTPVPPTSPYGLMRDYPAYALLVGVGLESCTAIHHPEEIIAPHLYVQPPERAKPYTLVDHEGREAPFLLRRHLKLNRNFEKFRPALESRGAMLTRHRAEKVWSVLGIAELMKDVFKALIEREDAILDA